MTKEVLIRIKGLQFIEGDEDIEPLEVVTAGEYFYRNGSHYVKYDEVYEGIEGVTKNLIKIKSDTVEVTKKGAANVHMVFEEKKKHMTLYNTPFGNMSMGIATTNINSKQEEDALDIRVDYALEMNNEHVADCNISMLIQPKNQKNFSLR